MFFSFDDFVVFAKYEIPKEIVWEWNDYLSLTYTTDRVKEYVKSLREVSDFKWNYLGFYRFINK